MKKIFWLLIIFFTTASVHARVVRDSVRSTTPIVLTETFDTTDNYLNYSNTNPRTYVRPNFTWQIIAGRMCNLSGSGFSPSTCVVLQANGSAAGSDACSSLTSSLIIGVKSFSWQATCQNANMGIEYRKWDSNEWKSPKKGAVTESGINYTLTFENYQDVYIRINCSVFSSTTPSSSTRVYIDNVTATTYPWIYSESEKWDFTLSIKPNKTSTICLPYAVDATKMQGAIPYRIYELNSSVTALLLEQVDYMEAGYPYIYVPFYGATCLQYDSIGKPVDAPQNENGLYGSFTAIQDGQEGAQGNILEGNCMIANNEVVKCGGYCALPANKAYIKLNEVPVHSIAGSLPENETIQIGVSREASTALIDAYISGNTCQKMWHNGQLIIRKGNNLYTVFGERVQ